MALTLGLTVTVQADDDTDMLQTVTVTATGLSNMLAASSGDVNREQLAEQPLLRPGAILENVPGLIVTQHSGAFNLDHGTDLATEVDDMPVNLPTHAHGQGYSDLNFLIPELVSDLHYKKGPYYADEGDFATAGAVRMSLLDQAAPSASLGFGQDGYRRALLLGSTALGSGTLLAAGEVYRNDGPFDVPDDYNRLNEVLRYQQGTERDYWTATAMGYSGRWNSTDQVPQRAIDSGLIDRYGSLNPSDGGVTARYSLSFNRILRDDSGQDQLSAYVIRYRLDLWSTFTYYLVDPVNGDQMLQHDDRVVYGLNAAKTWDGALAGMPMAKKLKSELVFDGDAGVTSPSGATTRTGVEWSNSYRISHWLSADFNAAFSRARFDRNSPPDDLGCGTAAPSHPCLQPIAITGRYIPNSPTNVIDAGLTAQHPTGWFGALRARHFGPSPLVEDNSARSPPYTTVDAQVGFRAASHWLVALDAFNIFNTRWNDIEYYYVSRLQNESAPAADYVVHPGIPRTLRFKFQFSM